MRRLASRYSQASTPKKIAKTLKAPKTSSTWRYQAKTSSTNSSPQQPQTKTVTTSPSEATWRSLRTFWLTLWASSSTTGNRSASSVRRRTHQGPLSRWLLLKLRTLCSAMNSRLSMRWSEQTVPKSGSSSALEGRSTCYKGTLARPTQDYCRCRGELCSLKGRSGCLAPRLFPSERF